MVRSLALRRLVVFVEPRGGVTGVLRDHDHGRDAPALLVTYQLLSEKGTTYKALQEKGEYPLRPVGMTAGKLKQTGVRKGGDANIEPKIRWEAGKPAGPADWSLIEPEVREAAARAWQDKVDRVLPAGAFRHTNGPS